MYPPINRQKAYMIPENHLVSDEVGNSVLSYVQLKDDDIQRICKSIRNFYS